MAVASLLVLVWTTNFTVIVIGNPSCIVSLLCVCVCVFLSFVQDDPVCIAARRDGKTLVTESWVEDSLDIGKVADAKRVGSICSLFFFHLPSLLSFLMENINSFVSTQTIQFLSQFCFDSTTILFVWRK